MFMLNKIYLNLNLNQFSWLLNKHKLYEKLRIRNRGFAIPKHLTKDSSSKRVQPTRGWTVAASTQHKLYSLLLPPAMGARFYRFLGRPAKWTRWLAGAAAIKSG